MITTKEELLEALAQLIELHSDNLHIEAKRLTTAYSTKAMGPTFSAFANLSGGGTILLGIDETLPNPIVGVDDPAAYAKSATNQARNGFSTFIHTETHTFTLDGHHIVAINVAEVATNGKPVFWLETKKAYIRQFDGDYAMSEQEIQQLLLRHTQPIDDIQPVPGTSIADLDESLTRVFLQNVREAHPRIAHEDDATVLRKLNVTTAEGTLTRAGLYSLGEFPQQYLPNLAITALVEPPKDADRTVRALHRRDFSGPIPAMLAEATQWVLDHSPTVLAVTAEGIGTTRYTFPPDAIREVIANALVHRDLSATTLGKSIEIRLNSDGLLITNPGGLWGLSIDTLIAGRAKFAVNSYLYTICRFVHGTHGRVIEALGSGVSTMQTALREAGLQEPYFFDNSVNFSVRFPRHSTHSSKELAWLASSGASNLNPHQREALLDMRRGTIFSNALYRARFTVDSDQARRDLQELVRRRLVISTGEKRGTRYHLADEDK